ncbi:MAG: tetratricopeptide repeat protein [Elusimicrobiales bacterium]|nr:tetratricopeptide repeat protein [Elusimicrobiales bacterium]
MAVLLFSFLEKLKRPPFPAGRSPALRAGLAAGLVFAAAFCAYLPALKHKFVADDFSLIVNNEFVSDPASFSFLLNKEFFSQTYQVKLGARPLTLLSLMADHAAWGLNPLGYHLTNLLLHGANSALVFFLGLALWRRSGEGPPAQDGTAAGALPFALLGGLIFALHPLQAEAVNVAAFRADLLCAFFCLAALLAFARAAYALALGGLVLALFSKETAVVLPLLALLQAFFFRGGAAPAPRWRRAVSVLLAAAAAAAFLLYFWAARFSYPVHDVIYPALAGSAAPLSSFAAYFNTLAAAASHYFLKLLLPAGLSLEYQLLLPGSLFNARFALLLALGAGALLVLRSRAGPLVKFGLGFMLAAYLPVSNLLPLVNTVADRYMYLPLAGFALLIPAGLAALLRGARTAAFAKLLPRAAAAACAVLLAAYAAGARAQAARFADMFSLYSAAAAAAPANPNARYNLALAYVERGDHRAALRELEAAAAASPLYRRTELWHLTGFCFEKLGDNRRARDYYAKVLLVEPRKETYNNLANIMQREGRPDSAAWLLKKSMELAPDPVSSNNLGAYYARKNKFGEALKYFRQAVALQPDYTEAWFNLLNACEASGDLEALRAETDRMARLFQENGWEVSYAN